MTRVAIIEPRTLVGEALRDALTTSSFPHQSIDLFSASEDEVGAVTEVAGGAGLVQALDSDALQNTEVAIFCGREVAPDLLDRIGPDTRSILVDPLDVSARWTPVVAGVSDQVDLGPRLVSPNPAVILLAHLLAPLIDHGAVEVAAHVLMPASARCKAGIDELFDQTRSILSMNEQRPEEIFGGQLAFNLLPWQEATGDLPSMLSTQFS